MTGPPLLDRRLCFVLGKGGVGKSTMSAALGVLGARAGKRTLLVEVAAEHRLSRLFSEREVASDRATELAPGLFGLSIEVERAIEEYLGVQLRVKALVEMLVRSRAFHSFAAAAPGLAELVTLGKIWELATELTDGRPTWDLLVVDCPATGHGIAMLEVAGRVSDLAASGPIREQSAKIAEVVSHPAATGIAVVARPEELAVSEAGDAVALLRADGLPVAVAILNGMSEERFSDADAGVLRAAAREVSAGSAGGASWEAVAAALAHVERQAHDRAHAAHLVELVDVPVAVAPELVRPRMDLAGIEALADALAATAVTGARPGALTG